MDKKTININELIPNSENPRFTSVKNEKEAIGMMIEKSGKELLNLAEDIVQRGFNPTKRLIVTPVNKKYLALEGNRRTVAAKLLSNPNLIQDEKYREKFKTLRDKYPSQVPKEIDVVSFKNPKDAFHWINLEHTGANKGRGVLSWNTEQRLRFLSQHGGKKPSKPVQVFDFADQNGIKRSNVDSTTLDNRLLGNPAVRQLIGIDFPEGLLVLTKSKTEVLRNIKKIFKVMSGKSFKVGDVYKNSMAVEWTKGILDKSISSITTVGHKRDENDRENRSESALSFPLNSRKTSTYSSDLGIEILKHISSNFSRAVAALKPRHDNRGSIEINDEYDVQDLMRIFLNLFFDQVYEEEWTPSYMGKASRVDFLLKPQKIVIEIKMASSNLTDSKLTSQLIVDTHHYNESQDCETLFIFVYDPNKKIKDPARIKADLERKTFTSLKTFCFIES
ncbi:hypothetical protein KW796_01820 [Candidatus Parcubacteria bacterium]|nr:hypothetical protein [Candidatus Parcubacteria bacterium]